MSSRPAFASLAEREEAARLVVSLIPGMALPRHRPLRRSYGVPTTPLPCGVVHLTHPYASKQERADMVIALASQSSTLFAQRGRRALENIGEQTIPLNPIPDPLDSREMIPMKATVVNIVNESTFDGCYAYVPWVRTKDQSVLWGRHKPTAAQRKGTKKVNEKNDTPHPLMAIGLYPVLPMLLVQQCMMDVATQSPPRHSMPFYIRYVPPFRSSHGIFSRGVRETASPSKILADSMLHLTIAELQLAGLSSVYVSERTCKNLVSATYFPMNVSLKRLKENDLANVTKPDKFPGASIHYPEHKPVTILVFWSGSLICIGAHSVEGAARAYNAALPQIFAAGIRPGEHESNQELVPGKPAAQKTKKRKLDQTGQ